MYQILDIKQNIDIGIGIYIYKYRFRYRFRYECEYRLYVQIKSLVQIKRPTYDIHKLVLHYDVTAYFKDTTS